MDLIVPIVIGLAIGLGAAAPAVVALIRRNGKITCSRGHIFRRRTAYHSLHCSGYASNRWCPTCFDKDSIRNLVESDVLS